MLNRIIFQARLAKDPESRVTANGSRVTTIRCAIDCGYGQNKSTAFLDCVAFNEKADRIAASFRKGSPIIIEGQIRQRTYQNKDGNNVTSTEVLIDSFEFMEAKKEQPAPQKKEQPKTVMETEDVADDDLPF